MKRIAMVLAVLCVWGAMATVALADTESLPLEVIVELADGQKIDLDGDGQAEEISFVCQNNDESSTYRLAVGESAYDGEGMYLAERLHAVRMTEYSREALLFVSDYGMSDDPTNYVFSYQNGGLRYIATIDTMPWNLSVTGENTLSGVVRGSILQTWYRPCVYVVSRGFFEEGDRMFTRSVYISEMPLSEYPMGTAVTVNQELALQVSPTNGDTACVLPAGSKAVIVSTDDAEWLYIEAVEPDYGEYEYAGGWLRVYQFGFEAELNGERVQTGDLFTGLLYAD